MAKLDIIGKATIGYIFMTVTIVLCVLLVYGNTKSVMLVDKAEKQFLERRSLTDSLVYSVLDVSNKERAICLGLSDKLPEYESAVKRTLSIADALKSAIGDASDTIRIDTLKHLVLQKRQNAFLLLATMGNVDADRLYREKENNLNSGVDSVVLKQKALEIKEDKETVYEVVKTKKTFFGRLADAFRKHRSDTVQVAQHSKKNVSDSLSHNVDISDTVADVLKQIRQQKAINERRNNSILERREQRQLLVAIQLSKRISQIMADIRSDEHNALQQSLDMDKAARQSVLLKIVMLAIAAATAAVALSIYIKKSIERERHYRRSIEKAKAETERIMKQREQLLLTITHDIKAPAASISGFIELLNTAALDPQTRLFIDNIGVSARHLLTLVEALLDYHRLDAGKVEPHPVPFCPLRLVADCVTAMRPQADAKALCLELHTDENASHDVYRGDSFRIKQIIDNLTGNAIKYTDNGSVSVTAKLDASIAGVKRWMTVVVSDTGRGMTEEECGRIFKAFTRLADANGTEGVGLGLAITKELVDMLGGKIFVKSTKGKGSVFTVSLPLEPVDENNVKEAVDVNSAKENVVVNSAKEAVDVNSVKENVVVNSAKENVLPEQSNNMQTTRCKRVLVVDDDPLQLKLLVEMLNRIDRQKLLTVKTTTHVLEAMQAIDTFCPQVLLMDIEMPEMCGTEAIGRIGKRHDLKVYAMTAHEPTIKDALLAKGFDGCLFKPFGIGDLAKILNLDSGESSTNAKPTDRFSMLISFADGDQEAEKNIFSSYIAELEQFVALLNNSNAANRRERVVHVAHKSLPLLKMVDSPKCTEIAVLQREYVAKLTEDELSEKATMLAAELLGIAEEMRQRI